MYGLAVARAKQLGKPLEEGHYTLSRTEIDDLYLSNGYCAHYGAVPAAQDHVRSWVAMGLAAVDVDGSVLLAYSAPRAPSVPTQENGPVAPTEEPLVQAYGGADTMFAEAKSLAKKSGIIPPCKKKPRLVGFGLTRNTLIEMYSQAGYSDPLGALTAHIREWTEKKEAYEDGIGNVYFCIDSMEELGYVHKAEGAYPEHDFYVGFKRIQKGFR